MNANLPHPSDRDFSKGFQWSLIVHLAVGTFVLLKTIVFPGKPITYTPTLRVDLVGLPDLLKKDLNQVPKAVAPEKSEPAPQKEAEKSKTPTSPKQLEEASPDEMVLKPKRASDDKKKTDKKFRNALDRIKALEKIKAMENAHQEPKAKSGVIIKGNKLSGGTSLSGEAKESAEASYMDLVRDKLQENWSLPIWLARQNLSAQIQLTLDTRGQVRSLRFVKSSGNAQFDEAVKKAVSDSQPFAAPPEDIASSLLVHGILIGFPL